MRVFPLVIAYSRWLIIRLVGIFFNPTRFEFEVEASMWSNSIQPELGFGKRFLYLLGLAPSLSFFAILWTALVVSALRLSGTIVSFQEAWLPLGVLLAIGILLGLVGGIMLAVKSIICT